MTVPSSLELISVSVETRDHIRGIQCQAFVGATMIETILVALENSLNLVGVVRHYQCFVISVSPVGSEPGGRTGECDLDALLLAALQDVSRFYPLGI
jgi:hypothetical protein